MRYMMLIYSKEEPGGPDRDTAAQVYAGHMAVMEAAARQGILVAAEPLARTSSATTVRVDNGRSMITDGPFAETKEQLAGYYILNCQNLDEAIEWAAKIPTGCKGGEGGIEIRPLPGVPARPESASADAARARNG